MSRIHSARWLVGLTLCTSTLLSCSEKNSIQKEAHSVMASASSLFRSPTSNVSALWEDSAVSHVTINRRLKDSTGTTVGQLAQTAIGGEALHVGANGEVVGSSTVPLRSAGHSMDSSTSALAEAEGAIVELTEEATLRAHTKAKRKGFSLQSLDVLVNERHSAIKAQHDRIKSAVSKAFGMRVLGYSKAKQKGATRTISFKDAINAVAFLDVSVEEVERQLKGNKDVRRITANTRVYGNLTVSVPQIKADQVWAYSSASGSALDGTGMRIGVIDTGVDYRHADLGGCFGPGCKVVGGYDFVNNDADPMDDQGHGTHVSATVAGNGFLRRPDGSQVPILGVAPGAKLYVYKVLDSNGSGGSTGIISAIEACANPSHDGTFTDRLDVCTMSLGGAGDPDDAMSRAVDAAVAHGVVFTIAAGNSGPSAGTIGSPGTARSAITVAASCKAADIGVDPNCTSPIAKFSSVGPVRWTDASGVAQTLAKPDIAAPGHRICAAQFGAWQQGNSCGDNHIAISGTSMATPHIAGVVALIRQAHPELSPAQIKETLLRSARSLGVSADFQGAGEVSAIDALTLSGIPNSIMRVEGLPIAFDDNVTQLNQSFSKTLTLTNLSSAAYSMTPQFTSNQAGLTASFDKPSFTLAAGASTTLVLTLRADHTQLVGPGSATGLVQLVSNAGTVRVGVTVGVQSRILTDARSLDLGVDFPDNASASFQKTLVVTNRLTDAGLAFSATVEFNRAGITGSVNPSSVNLNANGSTTLSMNVAIDNAQLANGRYPGVLKLTSALENLSIPLTFFKGYQVKVNRGPERVFLTLIPRLSQGFLAPAYVTEPGAYVFNMAVPGPYDLQATYWPQEIPGALGISVVRENVVASTSVTELSVNLADAIYKAEMKPLDKSGTLIPFAYFATELNHPRFTGAGVFVSSSSPANGAYANYSSALSSDYMRSSIMGSKSNGSLYSFDYSFRGASGNQSVTNQGSDLKQMRLVNIQNKSLDRPASPKLAVCSQNLYSSVCISGTSTEMTGIGQTPADVYGFTYNGSDLNAAGNFLHSMNFWSTLSDGTSAFTSNYYLFRGAQVTTFKNFGTSTPTRPYTDVTSALRMMTEPAPAGGVIVLGGGPIYDSTRWYNVNADRMTLYGSKNPGTAQDYGSGGDEYWSFDPNYVNPTYTLFRNGASVAAGVLNAYMYSPWIPAASGEGNYQFEMGRRAFIAGVDTLTKTTSTFRLQSASAQMSSPIDSNPPRISNLRLLSNGIVQAVLDSSVQNEMRIKLDPSAGVMASESFMSDSISQASLEMSSNGVNFSQIALTSTGVNEYTATLPAISAALTSFRLKASDLAGNTLTYEFQLPRGTAIPASAGLGDSPAPPSATPLPPMPTPVPSATPLPPMPTPVPSATPVPPTPTPVPSATPQPPVPGDTIAPQVTLTSPLNGAVVGRKGQVLFAATASDNIAVTRVDFHVNNTRVCSSYTSPYTCQWKSPNAPNGRYSVYARAYDAAGNVSQSSTSNISTR